MQTYKNLGGDSGVASYLYDGTTIIVNFKKGGSYLYTNASAGAGNINQMKQLADAGEGLGSFINTHVRKNYAKKLS